MGDVNKFETERYLLETLERISKKRSEYKVLYVNISKLKPKNRHPRFVKIIAKLFDDLVAVADGSLFILNNGDCVILGKNLTEKNIDSAVEKLRKGLVTDPIWTSHDSSEFTYLYQPEEFENFIKHIEYLIQTDAGVDTSVYRYPLDAGQIDVVKERLDEINVVDIVKHQKVLRFDSSTSFRVLFEEFFVAVKDLNKMFDRTVDLVANKWLFLYLTQTLDKKTMSSFLFSDIQNKPQKISLNLNLSTIFLPEFEDFSKTMDEQNQKVIAEVQVMDILNNMQLYFDAKEILHRKGYEILIDAASIEMLQALDVKKLEADYVKIFWHALMEEDTNNVRKTEVKQMIEKIGKERVILAKCLDKQALQWGVRNGIRSFQGPFMDLFDTVLTRKSCPNGSVCTTEECLKRKRYIAGALRDACAYKDFLEGKSELKNV